MDIGYKCKKFFYIVRHFFLQEGEKWNKIRLYFDYFRQRNDGSAKSTFDTDIIKIIFSKNYMYGGMI